MFKILTLLSITSFILCDQASWISKRPIDSAYYIGIGMMKKYNSDNYVQSAKNNALTDLSSEISINISSEIVDIMTEHSGMSEDESRSVINATTKAELENYELIDTWEDDYEYWVYYRLSKAEYKANIELKRQNAIDLSLNLFKMGKEKEINWNTEGSTINSAIEYYIQALKPIENYYGEPLKTSYNGNDIYLQNEIYSSLQWILSKIKLKAKKNKIDIKVGSSLKKELEVSASFTDNGKTVIVTNLPIKFSFIKGEGDLVKTIKTNSKGVAKGQIISISPTKKIQMIKASLDLTNYFISDSTSNYLLSTLKNVNTPSSKFIITVKGPVVYLESNENNLGSSLSIKIIEPKIKKYLSDNGFSFTEDISLADAMITIEADSRMGSEMYGQFISFLDMSISVTDMDDGEEVYKNSIQNKKGIQLSFEKAGLKAYRIVLKEIEEKIIMEILESMK